jgi:hypothetical protein
MVVRPARITLTQHESHREPLESEVGRIVSECRMVLPGLQALFGFQLIAVFNSHFAEVLPPPGRWLHLLAIVLVTFSIALIMAPAAYHRQVEPDRVSRVFARYASRLLTVAMAPLLVAIALEVALVGYAIGRSVPISAGLGAAICALYSALWYVYPGFRHRRPLN